MNKRNIEAIIRKAAVCRLGILDGDTPTIVPLCFGYRDNTLYFHGAVKSGKYGHYITQSLTLIVQRMLIMMKR